MKSLILTGLLGVAGTLYGQRSDSAAGPPVYRGFYPGMTVVQFEEAARSLSLTVACGPVVADDVKAVCQTPNAHALIGGSGVVNQLEVLAGLDSTESEVRYLIVLEPDSTSLRALLFGRIEAWGKPQENSEGLAAWHRSPYGMALGTGHGHRAVILGFARGPGPGISFDIGAVDDPPRLTACGELHYPDPLRAAGVAGKAVLQFVVGEDGHVDPASIKVLSADHDLFRDEAMRFIQTCSFRPGRIDRQSVRVLVQQTINFGLR